MVPRSNPNQPPAKPAPAGRIRIAIADDHPIFREGLRKLLELEEDFEVVAEAGEGKDVLQLLNQYKPDILLLDLKMPRVDGLSVLRKVQAKAVTAKIIVLTASEDEEEYVQAIRLGASGLVLKHAATESLLGSIRRVHAGELWVDARATTALLKQVASDAHPPLPLSRRESEVLALVCQGLKNKEIAERLFLSEQTVKNHLHSMFEKLGVRDRLELALYAFYSQRTFPGSDPSESESGSAT